MSRPISRVLSWTTIHLGPASPQTSSSLPESTAGRSVGFLFGLAPSGVYHATNCCQSRGALLPHHFNLTGSRSYVGGIFSAALSVGSRPPGVTWHLTLWSPDFPLPDLDIRSEYPKHEKRQRLPSQLVAKSIRSRPDTQSFFAFSVRLKS